MSSYMIEIYCKTNIYTRRININLQLTKFGFELGFANGGSLPHRDEKEELDFFIPFK